MKVLAVVASQEYGPLSWLNPFNLYVPITTYIFSTLFYLTLRKPINILSLALVSIN